MTQTKNKHGLKRYIAADIKKQIRRRCGFGCVRCGFGWYDYEHFNPDYCDAKEHNPDGMTLLCMSCNQKRNRGTLSRETVITANKNPKCLEEGFAKESFDYGTNLIEVKFASNTFIDCEHIICIDDLPILSIKNPIEESDTFLMSGIFFNSEGEKSFEIKDNEWFGEIDNWDIECIGKRIIIKENDKETTLIIRQEPPNLFVIEEINMLFNNTRIIGDENRLEIRDKDEQISLINMSNNLLSGHKIGVDIKEGKIGMGCGQNPNPYLLKLKKKNIELNYIKMDLLKEINKNIFDPVGKNYLLKSGGLF